MGEKVLLAGSEALPVGSEAILAGSDALQVTSEALKVTTEVKTPAPVHMDKHSIIFSFFFFFCFSSCFFLIYPNHPFSNKVRRNWKPCFSSMSQKSRIVFNFSPIITILIVSLYIPANEGDPANGDIELQVQESEVTKLF